MNRKNNHNPQRQRGILAGIHRRSLAYASDWNENQKCNFKSYAWRWECFGLRTCLIGVLVFVASMCLSSVAHASAGGTIIKAIARYLANESGETVTEQAVKNMTKQVGEELIERTATKVIREGGEQSLAEVGELVAKHGPEVIRALDNAPDALPVLKMLKELPAEDVTKAASRLAAGRSGTELATLGTKMGSVVLKAETKHPGVGMSFARALGPEGAELSLKLSGDQAIQIGRHVDDMAKLPAPQQNQLLELMSGNADRFAKFVGRFVEQNPGKVLFTAAGTTVILAESERLLGGSELEMDADGNPIVVRRPGLVESLTDKAKDSLDEPIAQTTATLNWLLWLLGLLVLVVIAGVAYSKGRILWHADRRRETAHRTSNDSAVNENASQSQE